MDHIHNNKQDQRAAEGATRREFLRAMAAASAAALMAGEPRLLRADAGTTIIQPSDVRNARVVVSKDKRYCSECDRIHNLGPQH